MNRLTYIQPPILWFLALCWLFFAHPAHSASQTLTAKVDRTTIEMGDILRLTLEANFQSQQSPDFSQLKDQFDVLNVQQSHQLIYTNSHLQSFTQWQVDLMPKLPGVAMIPPFKVAKAQSQPIKIHVQPATTYNRQQMAWLESQLSTDTPYVQQGLTYHLKLFYQGQLLDGHLRAPELKDALTKLLVNQKDYLTYRHGQRYTVIEWVYLFHPLHSGRQTLTPATLNGRLVTPNGHLLPLTLRTPSQSLQVKPKPSQYPKHATWLPAEHLTLRLSQPLPKNAKAGETLPLTLTLTAQGVRSAQLPTLSFPTSSDYKVYLDHQADHETVQGNTLISQRQFHYLLIPLKTGKLTLPTLQLPWWSLPKNQLAMAKLTLPTLTLSGQPTPSQATPTAHSTPKVTPSVQPTPPSLTENAPSSPAIRYWVLGGGLLLAMIIGIVIMRRRKPSPTTQSHTAPSETKEDLCQRTLTLDTLPDRDALITFYQHHRLSDQPAYQQLKRHLFAQPLAPEQLLTVIKTLCQTPITTNKPSVSTTTPDRQLKPIYPD